MSNVDQTQIDRLEMQSPQGLSSAQILEFFSAQKVALSEATLRKYVQLGLLPRSVRVGQKGKHRGSRGLYPVRVVRQIATIKQKLLQGYTIEQIRRECLFLRGEMHEVEEVLGTIFEKLCLVSENQDEQVRASLSSEVDRAREMGRELVARLRKLELRLTGGAAVELGRAQAMASSGLSGHGLRSLGDLGSTSWVG